jgi:hypothetical protein
MYMTASKQIVLQARHSAGMLQQGKSLYSLQRFMRVAFSWKADDIQFRIIPQFI